MSRPSCVSMVWFVVTACDVTADAPVGAVVTRIDGVPAAQRLAADVQLASGTTQWRQTRAPRSDGSNWQLRCVPIRGC
jgi:hypothetical protein